MYKMYCGFVLGRCRPLAAPAFFVNGVLQNDILQYTAIAKAIIKFIFWYIRKKSYKLQTAEKANKTQIKKNRKIYRTRLTAWLGIYKKAPFKRCFFFGHCRGHYAGKK